MVRAGEASTQFGLSCHDAVHLRRMVARLLPGMVVVFYIALGALASYALAACGGRPKAFAPAYDQHPVERIS